MKISVGMIAYNAMPVVEMALRSIYPHVDEIIIIDGSRMGPSTDGTAKFSASSFITRSGPRHAEVRVFSGTFARPDGSWDEQSQRQAYLNEMERGIDRWGILQDADEVFDHENALKLIEAIHEANKNPDIKVISHGFVHFWHSLNQVMTGGHWSRPRDVCAFRLTPELRTTNIVHVGEREGERFGQDGKAAMIRPDIFSYHYGHAMSFERLCFKVQEYFLAKYVRDNHGLAEITSAKLEDFMKEYRERIYHRQGPNIKSYDGKQPEAIRPLIGEYFK
jgi:hypothetical protein